jgi:hypothetical protein
MTSANPNRHAAGALRSNSSHLPQPATEKNMKKKLSSFAHLLGFSGDHAEIPEGTKAPFSHLMAHAERTAPGRNGTLLTPAAAAIIDAGEHARRAQEGGK